MMNYYYLLLIGGILLLIVLVIFFLFRNNILQATQDIAHPTKRGWRVFSIINNPNVSARLEYKRKSHGIEKGKFNMVFSESGKRVSRWNTHGRDDYSAIHHHQLPEERSEPLNFSKKPKITITQLRKIDRMSPEELKIYRKQYE